MSRGFPSMTALLGLLAVAGFQNRDKLSEMFGSAMGNQGGGQPGGAGQQPGGMGGGMGGLGGLLGGGGLGGLLGSLGGNASPGGLVSGGLGELVDSFRQNGHGDTVDSWVGTGPNKEVAPDQLEGAIGPDVLATLTQQTGLSREELLARLSRELPKAVDQYTPGGRLPSQQDF
ncbi:YidB family protein [Microvirga soli]|uniref:YidB family protein n=1 Tax=Microvirga soli TaxID=1854496 RepID=UPI00191E877F|nr:YidB family protein [Microvirga soli]